MHQSSSMSMLAGWEEALISACMHASVAYFGVPKFKVSRHHTICRQVCEQCIDVTCANKQPEQLQPATRPVGVVHTDN